VKIGPVDPEIALLNLKKDTEGKTGLPSGLKNVCHVLINNNGAVYIYRYGNHNKTY